MMKQYTLRELREKNNWTLEEVGKKMGGVSRQAVSMWETGVQVPNLRTIKKFLKIYEVKFEQVKWIEHRKK